MYRQNYPDDPGMHNRGPQSHGSRYYASHQAPSLRETLKSYCVAVLVGLGLLCAGCTLLFWNEGRTVQTYKSLEEGLARVRSLDSNDAVFEENNNKLIHLTGVLKTHQPLYDSEYGVAVMAVKLKRSVEMYQWVEYEKRREIQELDGIKTEVSYSYSEEWKDHLVDSSSFDKRQYNNPELFPIKPNTEIANEVQIGSFYLSTGLIEKITNFKQLRPEAGNSTRAANARVHDSMFYHGNDPINPQVGDLRVWFEYAGLSASSKLGPPDEVSVIGRQSKNIVTSFQTTSGDELEILYMGSLTAEAIFRQEQASNVLMSWGLRFVGWLLLFIGFSLMTSFISALVHWLPIIRDIVSLGTLVMCLSLSISVSLTVIAFGWLWYRPLFGAIVLSLAILPFVYARFQRGQTRGPRTDRMW